MNARALFLSIAVGLVIGAVPAHAQSGGGLKGVLADASDGALDKLSKPGAFSADDAIRITVPGGGKGLGDLMKLADRAGVTNDISGSLNRAAEQAAAEAKPIFRAAIDRLSLRDTVGIATGGNTAATDYLRKSAGGDITAKLLPLVRAALSRSGVLQQASQLSSLGLTDAKLTDYVTKKTSDGIFTYVGREETRIRQDPAALLKGLKF